MATAVSWTADRERYQTLATRVEPVAVVTTKEHWTWSALWWAGAILSLGLFALGLPRRRFLERFATTIGPRQGYPVGWAALSERIVAHESRHTTQAVWCGRLLLLGLLHRRLSAWVGLPLNLALYALLPLPIGLAAGRFFLERDADAASWRLALREGWLDRDELYREAERRAASLSSGGYVWAWPRRWAETSYRVLADSLWDEDVRRRNGEGKVGVL